MDTKLCKSCLREITGRSCPHCGYPLREPNDTHQLPVGTVLGDRYELGKVLGQGGFGITYLAWDREKGEKVAVKEFYPSSTVNRNCAQTVQVQCNTTQMAPHYQTSRERFLREAKTLSRFRDNPVVVNIRDFIEANNTAYIVMEFVQGMDLAHYVSRKGGRLSVEETLRILRPIMEALAQIHKEDIVHRDISPDNIVLHPTGGAKLLDFGAVRSVTDPDTEKALTKSTEAILKHGFAPIEQYQTRGSLGPWTDEYAMCATIWYCLTGTIFEEATTRMAEETDPAWHTIPGLTPAQQKALARGSAVRARDRYPGMDELLQDLFPAPDPEPEPQPIPEPDPEPAPEPVKPPVNKKSGGKKWGLIVAAVLAVAVGAGAFLLKDTGSGQKPEDAPGIMAPPSSTPQAASSNTRDIPLTVWINEVHQDSTQALAEVFSAQDPGISLSLTTVPMNENDAKYALMEDSEENADIFVFTSPDLYALQEAGLLAPLGSVSSELDWGASMDGQIYGYPIEVASGYFMYFDASFFTNEDLCSLNTMCEKAATSGKKIVLDLGNPWYLHSFFAGAGLPVQINADGVTNTCNWNSPRGEAVCRGIADLVDTGVLVPFEKAYDHIAAGEVVAMVSGTWDAATLHNSWGSNYGCAAMPSFLVDGEPVDIIPFTVINYVGVDPNSEDLETAIQFAQHLASPEAQLLRYVKAGSVPVSKELIDSDHVFLPEVWIQAVQAQTSIPMNVGASFWSPASELGETLMSGLQGVDLKELLDRVTRDITDF